MLKYYINLDERGEFYADVRRDDETIFEIKDYEFFEDGFMRHKGDLLGLSQYLYEEGICGYGEVIEFGN